MRMKALSRVAVIFMTVGWIAPLCASFWATHDFIWNVVWPAAAYGKRYMAAWHPFDFAAQFFYFSMAWLACVLAGWAWFLTRPRSR
jgi:hypothetical protein